MATERGDRKLWAFRPRTSLRVLFGICGAIAVMLGAFRIYLLPLIARADAENDLVRVGAIVQRGKSHFFLNSSRRSKARPAGSNWETFLSRVTQREIRLEAVTGIHFYLAQRPASDHDLQQVSLFPDLEVLDLAPGGVLKKAGASDQVAKEDRVRLSDVGVEQVAQLPNLRALAIGSSIITDDACRALARSQSLETLAIRSPLITDDGLRELAQMRALKSLELSGTCVTGEAVEEVRRRRPELKVKLFSASSP